MAQVSYGTITITDTNDIERIYTVYAKSANNTTVPVAAAADWKESISEAPGTGNYIWQRTVVQKSGTQEKTYSDPVCLTGEEGTDGKGITSITIKYGTSADWNTQPSSWYDNTPEYNSSTPNYWTQTTISYTSGNPTVKVTQDKALTQAIHDSVMANSLAQSANENANGAMGQAASNVNEVKRIWFLKNSSGTPSKPTSSTTIYNDNAANHWTTIRPTVTGYRYYYYCEQTTTGGGVKSWSDVYLDSSELSEYEIGAMKTRFQNFFYPGDSNYPGAYAVGKSSSDGLDITDISTYGYNLRLTPTALSIGYNELKAIEIDGTTPALNLYKPSKTSQGAQTARLDANGLVLSEGGLEAGTKNTTDYIYLYSTDEPTNHTINIINSGNKSDWRIIAGNKFGVDKAGNLYASNATISGAITATSLALGSGVTISTNDISGLSTVATSGSYNDLDNKPTIPSLTGYIHTDGTIGSTAAEGANSFTVASSGALTASNAIIYGTLYASKGYIGGWQIGTDGNKSLHNGSSNTSPTIGSGTIILSKGLTSTTSIAGSSGSQTWTIAAGTNFGVTTAGKLYATGAEISGDLTASSLKINGNNYLTDITTISSKASGNAEYEVVIKVNSIDYTNSSATLIAIPTKLGESTTGSFVWYKNAINTAHGGTVSTTTNTNDTLTVSDLEALYIAVLQ